MAFGLWSLSFVFSKAKRQDYQAQSTKTKLLSKKERSPQESWYESRGPDNRALKRLNFAGYVLWLQINVELQPISLESLRTLSQVERRNPSRQVPIFHLFETNSSHQRSEFFLARKARNRFR